MDLRRHGHDLLQIGAEEAVGRRRAHLAAEAHDDPSAERAILDVAQLFADEFAVADPGFDRVRFIVAATEDPCGGAT